MNHRIKTLISGFLILLLIGALLGTVLTSATGSMTKEISAEAQFARARSAVLYVRSFYASGGLKSTGSGFLIRSDGLALTAAHVVDKAARITVRMSTEEELECELISSDTETDIAVLRLPPGTYPSLALSRSEPASGAQVRAMGFPTKDALIITEGLMNAADAVVSEKHRAMVSCDIVNGMSGGPVFDRCGQVIGLCSGSVRTMSGIHLSARWNDLITAVDAAAKT